MEEVRLGARRVVVLSSSLVYGHAIVVFPTEDEVIRPEGIRVCSPGSLRLNMFSIVATSLTTDRWQCPNGDDGPWSLSSLARALAAGSGRRLGDEEPPAVLHIDDLAAAIETVADLNTTELSMSHQMVGFWRSGTSPSRAPLAVVLDGFVSSYGLCSGGFSVDRFHRVGAVHDNQLGGGQRSIEIARLGLVG